MNNLSCATSLNLPRRRRLLSVIIPAYNVAKTLPEQLNALKAQAYEGDWEVIVVDNGSSDNTYEVVQKYMSHMPNLRLVRDAAKRSGAYARNCGAGVAEGDALLFCDGDDVVAPGWLAGLAAALEQHDFVAGVLDLSLINKGNVWCPSYPNWALAPCLKFLPFAGGSLMAVSREAFKKVGGFADDILVAEDVDLSWRLQLQGYRLHCAKEARVHVRCRSTRNGLWRQTTAYAVGHVWLFKRFRAFGMPRPTFQETRAAYRQLLRNMLRWPKLPQRERMKVLRMVAARWGRLKGAIRYRTLYL